MFTYVCYAKKKLFTHLSCADNTYARLHVCMLRQQQVSMHVCCTQRTNSNELKRAYCRRRMFSSRYCLQTVDSWAVSLRARTCVHCIVFLQYIYIYICIYIYMHLCCARRKQSHIYVARRSVLTHVYCLHVCNHKRYSRMYGVRTNITTRTFSRVHVACGNLILFHTQNRFTRVCCI